MTFSPDSSPEHPGSQINVLAGLVPPAGLPSKDLGLEEGTFKSLMRVIDDGDDDDSSQSSSTLGFGKQLQMRQSQLDGMAVETCSRSSISMSPTPDVEAEDVKLKLLELKERTLVENPEPEKEKRHNNLETCVVEETQPVPSTSKKDQPRKKAVNKNAELLKRQRMAPPLPIPDVKPKSKFSLIKNVFKTYVKSRKIVMVKYRKPEARFYELEEFLERREEGTLDEPYDEDTDDPTLFAFQSKSTKSTPVKKESKSASRSNTVTPNVSDSESDDDSEAMVNANGKYQCNKCPREFVKLVRFHAHRQMHKDSKQMKKRKKSVDEERISQVDGAPEDFRMMQVDGAFDLSDDEEEERIMQVDGEHDLELPNAPLQIPSSVQLTTTTAPVLNTGQILTTQPSTSGLSLASAVGNPSQQFILSPSGALTPSPGSSHVFIIRKNDGTAVQLKQVESILDPQGSVGQAQQQLVLKTDPMANTGHHQYLIKSDSMLPQHPLPSQLHHQPIKAESIASTCSFDPSTLGSSSLHQSGSSSSASSSTATTPNSLHVFAKELLNTEGAHPMLNQDPVLMSSSGLDRDELDSLELFDGNLDTTDSAIHLSLDDLANFAQPMTTNDGSHASFDTSIEETASFLSGADALDIASETTNGTASISLPDFRSESGTPSLPDEGEFPCDQCDKKFGNRRNLISHMKRHNGDFKLFCEDCGKGFFTQSKLDSHKRKHTGTDMSSKI